MLTCLWFIARVKRIDPTMSLFEKIAATAPRVRPKLMQLYWKWP